MPPAIEVDWTEVTSAAICPRGQDFVYLGWMENSRVGAIRFFADLPEADLAAVAASPSRSKSPQGRH